MSVPAPRERRALEAQLDRVRLESDTLYEVISVIASAPDLAGVLARVVELLTAASDCHACFVYLRTGERLRLRAASQPYAHVVDQIEFGVDEGLVGWTVRTRQPAVIRENAMDDPRTSYVAALQEERFQSMVAVPVLARSSEVIGVIVLHTVAPREFDQSTLNFLVHAATLLAGAIENATLYEQTRRRVEHLQGLSHLAQRIAGVDGREQLYAAATTGVRELLGADAARLYELDRARGRLLLAAADPPAADTEGALRDLDPSADHIALLASRLARDEGSHAHRLLTPVSAGEAQLAILLALADGPFEEDADELLRAIAGQLAVALENATLIERLTGVNIVHDLFAAIDRGDSPLAEQRAREARLDLTRPFVALCMQLCSTNAAHDPRTTPDQLEATIHRLVPEALCEIGEELRALAPGDSGAGDGGLALLDQRLDELAAETGLVVGRSEPASGINAAPRALREAADAARLAQALRPAGGVVRYGELGAYRYLAHISLEDVPDDRHCRAIETLIGYDGRRGTALVQTLERYLASGRAVAPTARALVVHPNTLRQRLERIETLTELDLECEDMLSLELALKLVRLRSALRRERTRL